MEVSVRPRHLDLQLGFDQYRAAFSTIFGFGRHDALLRLPASVKCSGAQGRGGHLIDGAK
jgi:hypothetical protein